MLEPFHDKLVGLPSSVPPLRFSEVEGLLPELKHIRSIEIRRDTIPQVGWYRIAQIEGSFIMYVVRAWDYDIPRTCKVTMSATGAKSTMNQLDGSYDNASFNKYRIVSIEHKRYLEAYHPSDRGRNNEISLTFMGNIVKINPILSMSPNDGIVDIEVEITNL